MNGANPWQILGVRPTIDQAAVRRAYAKRLKQTHPEDDPEGFKLLRWAFDTALAQTRRQVAYDEPAGALPAAPEARPRPRGDTVSGPNVARPGQPGPAQDRAELEDERASLEALRAACARVEALVEDPSSDRAARREAMERAIALAKPLSIAMRERAEDWTARLIGRNTAETDSLITVAMDGFGWEDGRVGRQSPAAEVVLARYHDLRYLQVLGATSGPDGDAFSALKGRPTLLRKLWWRLHPLLRSRVGSFLNRIGRERPAIINSLDPDALEWWQAYLSRPRLSAAGIWIAVVAPFFISLFLIRPGPVGRFWSAYFALLPLSALLVGLHLYAIQWPRKLWAERWAWRAPALAKFGWAPAALLAVLGASAAPVSAASTIVFAVLGAGIVLWAAITGEIDRSPGRGADWRMYSYVSLFTLAFWMTQWAWRPGMRYPWPLRALFAFAYLAWCWSVAHNVMAPAEWRQIALPVAAAAASFVLGGHTLAWEWQELGPALRAILAGGLAAATALVAALLWSGIDDAGHTGLLLGLVSVLVVAHKPLETDLEDRSFLLRDMVMRYGWIGWMLVAAAWARGAHGVLAAWGLWLLSGVAIAAGAVLVEHLRALPVFRRRAA